MNSKIAVIKYKKKFSDFKNLNLSKFMFLSLLVLLNAY